MSGEKEVEITSEVIYEMLGSVKCGCGAFVYKRGYEQHCESKKHKEWLISLENLSDTTNTSTTTTTTRGRASK